MKRVIRIKRHPFGGDFLAINLFGFIFTREELTPVQLNHELIHSRQQLELLYLPFFLWYVAEWLVLCVKYRDGIKAYFHISFEREAYTHERDLTYLSRRKPFAHIR